MSDRGVGDSRRREAFPPAVRSPLPSALLPVLRSPLPSASMASVYSGRSGSRSGREEVPDSPAQRSATDRESFTDSTVMHMVARASTPPSITMERVKLSETPEDPERIVQELQHVALSRQRKAQADKSRGSSSFCCRCCSCVCGGLVLTVGLAAAALYVSPELRRRSRDWAAFAQRQAGEVAHEVMLRDPWAAVRGGSLPPVGGGARAAGAGAATAAEVGEVDQEVMLRDPWAAVGSGKLPPVRGGARAAGTSAATTAEVPAGGGDPSAAALPPPPVAAANRPQDVVWCNRSRPAHQVTLRTWNLPDGWRRVCERKNVQDKYPLERNWCWWGLNSMCHWNLKAHHSWSTLQDMAAKDGYAPPRSMAPFDPLEEPELCDRPQNGAMRKWTEEERTTSRQWFKDHVSVYVVSLPGKGENRWQGIRRRLDELQIWAQRVPGVDMTVPGALQDAVLDGFVPERFNYSKAQEVAYTWKQNMGSMLGTVGCAAAHFKVQTKVIADGSPLAIVMEDDSYPSDDFIPRVWSLVTEELPCDWQVTALLSRCGYGRCVSPHLMRVMPDANEPAWRCRQGSNWGMHAVLYRVEALPEVQKLWKKTVFDEERPHCMDVDVALASISDQVGFYAVPAVQDPGFLRETNHRSARYDINQAFQTTATKTTTTYYVPTVKPGEPWPGAWNFG